MIVPELAAQRGRGLRVAVEQGVLGVRVQAGRRLVEHDEQRVGRAHRPAERELLPLAAGQARGRRCTALPTQVARPYGQLRRPGRRRRPGRARPAAAARRASRAGRPRRPTRPRAGANRAKSWNAAVQRARQLVGRDRRPAARRRPGSAPDVGLVHAEQQLDERRLARAVLPDDGHRRPGRQRAASSASSTAPLGARVAEGDVAQRDARPQPGRARRRPGGGVGRGVMVLEPEQPVGGRQGGDQRAGAVGGRGQLGARAADQRDRHQHGAERDPRPSVARDDDERDRGHQAGRVQQPARPTARPGPGAPRGRLRRSSAPSGTRAAAARWRRGRRSAARRRRTRSADRSKSMPASRRSAAIASSARLVIGFATRSAISGGTARHRAAAAATATPSRAARAGRRSGRRTRRCDSICRGAAASWRRLALSRSTWAR